MGEQGRVHKLPFTHKVCSQPEGAGPQILDLHEGTEGSNEAWNRGIQVHEAHTGTQGGRGAQSRYTYAPPFESENIFTPPFPGVIGIFIPSMPADDLMPSASLDSRRLLWYTDTRSRSNTGKDFHK